ncbi:hypothetical protein RRG08_045162 [Elysia crispata]|uniref:Uncharacterized protein n=1 Tax=Elysia crispata TaxID=231223 RepID=A0AAE1A3C8_9GAST|nr:hypothetical protein RRG08_045162 [Elysia crispata]
MTYHVYSALCCYSVFRSVNRKRPRLISDQEHFLSRYYMMKDLSEHNKCYDRCKYLKFYCESDGYLTFVNGRCTCVCPPGLDPSTGCRSVFTPASTKREYYPSGDYALPLLNSSDDCPSREFEKKSITLYFNKTISKRTYRLFYCVHTRRGKPNIQWPLGYYCIFKTARRCPRAGFQRFRTRYTYTADADASKTKLKRLVICCKSSGFAVDEIWLPFGSPFTLIQNRKGGCRPVKGMYLNHNEIPYRVERKTSSERKKKSRYTLKLRKKNITLCSYRPASTDCGGVFQLNKASPSYSFNFSNKKEIVQCTWFFKGSGQGARFVLDIDDIAIEHVSAKRKCTQYSTRVNKLEIRYQRPGEPGISVCSSFPNSIIGEYHTLVLRLVTVGRQWANLTATVRVIEEDDLCYRLIDNDFEPCLPWSETTECRVHMFNDRLFLSRDLEGNKCRNPTALLRIKPWCYTDKKDCKWNYCDVCLLGRLYDTRRDCYKTGSAMDCPIHGCAKTCSHVLPTVDRSRKFGQIKCDRPTDRFPKTEIDFRASASTETYDVGETIKYKCQKNFLQYNRHSRRMCLLNGQWSSMGPVCYHGIHCTDMWHKCAILVEKYPAFCREPRYNGMPEIQCAFTCGFCMREKTPECVVEVGGALTILRNRSISVGTRVHRGDSVSYMCRPSQADRFFPDSGNEVRVCLASGKWSGSKLSCRNECPRNWKYYPENRMCYKKFIKLRSYFQALEICSAFEGGQLVSLKSLDEWRFIRRLNPALLSAYYVDYDAKIISKSGSGSIDWCQCQAQWENPEILLIQGRLLI